MTRARTLYRLGCDVKVCIGCFMLVRSEMTRHGALVSTSRIGIADRTYMLHRREKLQLSSCGGLLRHVPPWRKLRLLLRGLGLGRSRRRLRGLLLVEGGADGAHPGSAHGGESD